MKSLLENHQIGVMRYWGHLRYTYHLNQRAREEKETRMTSVFRARGWGGGGASPRNEEAEAGTSQGIQCSVWGLWAL